MNFNIPQSHLAPNAYCLQVLVVALIITIQKNTVFELALCGKEL